MHSVTELTQIEMYCHLSILFDVKIRFIKNVCSFRFVSFLIWIDITLNCLDSTCYTYIIIYILRRSVFQNTLIWEVNNIIQKQPSINNDKIQLDWQPSTNKRKLEHIRRWELLTWVSHNYLTDIYKYENRELENSMLFKQINLMM